MSRPPTPLLPPKKDVAMLLLQGPSLFIHLDPRKPQVVVPAWFKKQPQLILQVGLNMANPIPDLNVDDEGITGTLSFSRSPFWCRIPWASVYALVGEDGRGMLWPNDVPSEVAAQLQVRGASPPPQQPKLRAVPNPDSSAPSTPTGGDATNSQPKPAASPGRPAVKLVRSDQREGTGGEDERDRIEESSESSPSVAEAVATSGASGSEESRPVEPAPAQEDSSPNTVQAAEEESAAEEHERVAGDETRGAPPKTQRSAGIELSAEAREDGGSASAAVPPASGEPADAAPATKEEDSKLPSRRPRGPQKRPAGSSPDGVGQASSVPKKLSKGKKSSSKSVAPEGELSSRAGKSSGHGEANAAIGEPSAQGRGKRDKGTSGPGRAAVARSAPAGGARANSGSPTSRNTDVTPSRVPSVPGAEPNPTVDPSGLGRSPAVPGASPASSNPQVPAPAGRPSSRPKRDLPPYLRVIK